MEAESFTGTHTRQEVGTTNSDIQEQFRITGIRDPREHTLSRRWESPIPISINISEKRD
jgi:hypothetical protein